MSRYCSVPTCGNNDIISPDDVFYFLPDGDDTRKEWVQKCEFIDKWETLGIKPFYSTVAETVCSQHFKSSDYLEPEQTISGSLERKLKSDAIPSLNLPPSSFMKNLRSGKLIRRKSSASQEEEAAKCQLSKLHLQTGNLQDFMEALLQKCTFHGIGQECHIKHGSRTNVGLLIPSDADKILLTHKTGISWASIQNICYYHDLLLLKNPLRLLKCCDPFKEHELQGRKGWGSGNFRHRQTITFRTYEKIKHIAPFAIPGETLCISCNAKVNLYARNRTSEVQPALDAKHREGKTAVSSDQSISNASKGVHEVLDSEGTVLPNKSLEEKDTGSKKTKPEFVCNYCSLVLANEVSLKEHLIRVHLKEFAIPFACSVCKKTFDNRLIHKKHESSHGEEMMEQRSSDRKSSLRVIKEKLFVCHVCLIKFHSRADLGAHVELHNKPHKPVRRPKQWFECGLCDVRLISRNASLLNKHAKLHQGNPFSCDFCERTFTSDENLQEHVTWFHSGYLLTKGRNVPFQCSVCSESFARLGTLKKHHRVHVITNGNNSSKKLRETLLTCNVCSSKFRREIDFNAHMEQAHANLSAHSCKSNCTRKMQPDGDAVLSRKVCGNKFERDVDFSVRFEPAHADASNQQSKRGLLFCDLCGLSFPIRRDLNKHLAKTHAVTKLFPCNICGKRFRRHDDHSKHQADHKVSPHFKCGICKKILATRSSFEKHFRIHVGFDTRRFFCTLCGAGFCNSKTLLRHHVIKHVPQELPYELAHLSEPVLMNISFLCNISDMYVL